VKFVAVDKGHNAETIKDMLPEGTTPFTGKSGEHATKFDQEGVYGVKCLPHHGMGIVAMIVVDNPANEDRAKAVPRWARPSRCFPTCSASSTPTRPQKKW
jgi:pseudoazurin